MCKTVCEISGRPIARGYDKFDRAMVIGFTIDRWSMMLLPSKKRRSKQNKITTNTVTG